MPVDEVQYLEPPPKFQHKYVRHIVLLVLTLGTTTLIGWTNYAGFLATKGAVLGPDVLSWAGLRYGLWFSIPLLLILGAHEFGHYWYCRKYNIDASLPYFLPIPLPPAGTMGAVIRIREPFPSKVALFDVAVAGPIAGFVVLVPFLIWGLTQSTAVRFVNTDGVTYFGEPLLLKLISWWWFGPLPQGFDEVLHPTAFAGWFGMLATALNLLPFGQLDGGHISYAALGRRARLVSGMTLAATLLLAVWSASLIATAIIMMVMAFLLGLRHPQIPDEHIPLDRRRQLIVILAIVMFAVCFTPVPIQLLGS